MERKKHMRDTLAKASDVQPSQISFRPTSGGCINQAAIADIAGRPVFCKWNDRLLPRQFGAEATGLKAMRAAKSSLIVPEVIAFDDGGPGQSFLALAFLESRPKDHSYDEALGHGLAELHRNATDPRGYGFGLDGYCGATPQPNPWSRDWPSFYRDHRLGHQVQLARGNGMQTEGLLVLDRLIDRLSELLRYPTSDPSSLIHGDLWSGNAMATPSPTLVDPAAYFAHREAELGMMKLFGGFSERVYHAYEEAWPLIDGWKDRLDLYALYHVLNHFNLFGGGYEADAVRIARRFV